MNCAFNFSILRITNGNGSSSAPIGAMEDGQRADLRFEALRRKGDQNTAEQKGNLRDGHVPAVKGFMEWAGLKGKRIEADYEYLYGHHPNYFNSQEEVRAAVELVLSKPERVKDLNGNLSFVGVDEKTGTIYRIEISPKLKINANHVRSIFIISEEQHKKNKTGGIPGSRTGTN